MNIGDLFNSPEMSLPRDRDTDDFVASSGGAVNWRL